MSDANPGARRGFVAVGDGASHVAAVGGIAAFLGAIATCLFPPWAPGQDTPPHVVAAAVMRAPEVFAPWFEVHFAPTAQAFEWLIVIFGAVASLVWATKLALVTITVGLALGTARASRALGGSPWLGLALGSAYAVGWQWAMGFHNFTAALAIGVWAIPLLFGRPATGGRRLGAAALLVLAAVAHIIAAAMLLAHLLGLRFARLQAPRAEPRVAARTLLADAATALPALAYVLFWGISAVRSTTHDGGSAGQIGTRFGSAPEVVWDLAATTFGGFTSLGFLAAAGALAVVVAGWRRDRAMTALWGGWAMLMVALPLHGLGWAFVRPRCGFFALVSAVAGGRGATGRVGAWASVAAAAVVWAGLPGAVAEGERARQGALGFGESTAGVTLEVVFHPETIAPSGPHVRSAIGLPHYATLHGGAVAGAFATNPIKHALAFRGGMASVFPPVPTLHLDISAACMATPACYVSDVAQADRIAVAALQWDAVALVGAPDGVIERLVERGLEPEEDGPNLLRPRTSTLVVPLPESFRGPVRWRAGYPDTVGSLVEGAAMVEEPGAELRLTPLPAGPIAVEIQLGEHTKRMQLALPAGAVTTAPLPGSAAP